MPYNLPFERLAQLDNIPALVSNKLLANALLAAFPEIHDLNGADSSAHFSHFEIDPEDESPEHHFRLCAEHGEMNFSFDFWRNTLWVELGTAGNPAIRFAHVRRYAAFIVRHGFALCAVSGPGTLTMEAGIEEHFKEYKEWTGFVNRVAQTISNTPSSPV